MAPFRSRAQAKFMFARHPKTAKKWAGEGHGWADLPARVGKKRKKERQTERRAYRMMKGK